MLDVENMIEGQESSFNNLAKTLQNLTKSATNKRTEEFFQKSWESAKADWEQIKINHATLGATEGIKDKYFADFQKHGEIFLSIQNFITQESSKRSIPTIILPEETEETRKYILEQAASSLSSPIEPPVPVKSSSWLKTPTNTFPEVLPIPVTQAFIGQQPNETLLPPQPFVMPQQPAATSIPPANHPSWDTMYLLQGLQQLNNQRSTTRGPEITVTPFNGDIKDYRRFKQNFNVVTSRSNFSRADCFSLLMQKLSGTALDSVRHLDPSYEQNYDVAWHTLDALFDSDRLVFETNLNSILQLNKMEHVNTPLSILKLLQTGDIASTNLKSLKIDTDHVIAFHVINTLNSATRTRLEDMLNVCNTEIPAWAGVRKFLEQEYKKSLTTTNVEQELPKRGVAKTHATIMQEQKIRKCFICEQNHSVLECPTFLASTDREKLMAQHKVCKFCCRHRFVFTQRCNSQPKLKCAICNGKHITEMHRNPSPSAPTLIQERDAQTFLSTDDTTETTVIMPTVVAEILSNISGCSKKTRGLLDFCSTNNYISEDIAASLKLKTTKVDYIISGVGNKTLKCSSKTTITIRTSDPKKPTISFECLILPKIANKAPLMTSEIPAEIEDFVKNGKVLADPSYNIPRKTQLLIGGAVAPYSMTGKSISAGGLLLQETYLGWVVQGEIRATNREKTYSTYVTHAERETATLKEFETQLKEFWDLPLKEEDDMDSNEFCEKLFKEKHYRLEDGRYVVPMPFRPDAPTNIGTTYRKALGFFLGQERNWRKHPELYQKVNAFMKEYIDRNHMVKIPQHKLRDETGEVCYIKYFSILRDQSLTTKLRNVFDASAPSTSGISLNDIIYPGPKLQTHITTVINQARQFKYIYAADVEKMFRQINLCPEDSEKLRMIWRSAPNEPLQEYRLNTVTYGIDAAPWQAIRTMHQIADDNAPDDITNKIIKKAFYVDDLLYGGHTIEECQEQVQKIKKTMDAGKFPLTKWTSNDPEILRHISPAQKIFSVMELGKEEYIRTLGLYLDAQQDHFQFKIKELTSITPTKRKLLSIASSLYDPLGFHLPVTMDFRMKIQTLWLEEYDWDEVLPTEVMAKFQRSIEALPELTKIKIRRWIATDSISTLELIGFSDASKNGFAAAVYSRVRVNNSYVITLLQAKGRVTPLKNRSNIENGKNTIPKLELQAVLLLAELFTEIIPCFPNLTLKIRAYCDNEAVIQWIRQNDAKIKHVKKRIKKIRRVIEPHQIHYVSSEDNPADLPSRGATADKLMKNELWFNGPTWLTQEILPETPFESSHCFVTVGQTDKEDTIIEQFSEYNALIRCSAVCLRWFTNFKTKKKLTVEDPITSEEIREVEIRIIKLQQQRQFSSEISNLKREKQLHERHWMASLMPFLGDHDILRVGGRLENASSLTFEQQHPILLKKCHLVDLLIRNVHLSYGHGGNRLVERVLTDEYWVPAIKKRIKHIIRTCTTCIRWRAQISRPLMGQLPTERVEPAPAFSKIGVDIAGYFNVRPSHLKFDRFIKMWVCVFVCLVTKAVHLETLSDLTSDGFLAAFIRMSSRRGVPSLILSDNGTNFVGANKKLAKAWAKIKKDASTRMVTQQITWKFIPVKSPWFGSIWESSVKTMKYFVKRMATVEKLTMEEFGTLLCKIEGFMNSRPLYPNSSDATDPPAITPFQLTNLRSLKNNPADVTTLDHTALQKDLQP